MTSLDDHVATLFSEPDEPEPQVPEEVPAEPAPTDPSPPPSVEAPADPAPQVLPPDAEPQEAAPSIGWERIAQARLREINAIRLRHSETKEKLTLLEKKLEDFMARMEPKEEISKEMLEADPALRFVTNKISAIEGELRTSRTAQEEQAEFQRDTMETVRYAQESRQAFLQHTPDWDQAYQYLRERYAEANGKAGAPDKEEWLNIQEHIASRTWRENGEDPALKVYELAMESGYRPGAPPALPRVQPGNNGATPRIRRVRDAVSAPSPSSIGARDMGRDVISRAEFYDQYPQSERIRIFNSEGGEDIFEALMKEGRVPVSMLASLSR